MNRVQDIRSLPDATWAVFLFALSFVALVAWKGGGSTAGALIFAFVLAVVVLRPRAGLSLVILTAPIRSTLFLADDGFSATRLMGLAVAIGMILTWFREARLPRVGWPAIPLVLLAVLALTSIFPRPDLASAAAVTTLAQYILLAVIVADVAAAPRAAVQLCVVVAASALMTALMMIGDYLPFALAARGAQPERFLWSVDPQSTLLATFFATGTLAVVAVWSEPLRRHWRMVLVAVAAPMMVALVVLNSRLASVALVAGVLAFALAGPGVLRRLPLAAGVVVSLAALAVTTAAVGLWDPGMRYRAVHSLDSPYEATSGRTVIWRVGARVFAEHPVRGVGLSRFPEHFERIRTSSVPPLRSKPSRTPHGDFIGLAAELGAAGPLLLIAALVLMALPLVRREGSQLAPAAFGWLAMIAVLMAGLDMTTQWQTWVGLGVVMGVGRRG